jgi:hypothetical protein
MEGFGKLQKMGCGCSVPHMKDGGYVSKARAEEDQGFKATKKAVGGAISIIDAVGKPVGGSVAPGKPSAKDRRAAMKLKPKVSVEIPLGMKKGGKMADGGIVPIVKAKKVEPVKAKPADDSTPSPKVQEEMRKARDEARELKLMEDAYTKAGGELKFAKGGTVKESAKDEKAETKKIAAISKELKSHEKLPASKGHKGLKCGGKVKKMAEGGIVPGSDYWANRAATRALPPSASAPAMESSPSTQMAYHSAAVPSAGTLTPQEEVARRIGLRANPAAGNPQAYDPAGQAVYVGGSKAAQTQALQQAQAALPATSKLYKAAPAVTSPSLAVMPPPTGNGQGAGTGSGGAYTFEDQARDRYGINPAPSQVGGDRMIPQTFDENGIGWGQPGYNSGFKSTPDPSRVGSVTSPPIQSGGLPFQNMGGNPFQSGGLPFQNMGGNPLGFLNQNNLGGQNKYLPQLAQVIGNRLGYPQQGGGTKFERPSQPPQGIDGRGERGYPDGQGGFTTQPPQGFESFEPWQGGWNGTPQPQRGGNGGFDLGNIAGHAMEYLKDPSSLMKSRRPSGNTLGSGQSVEEQWQAHDNQLAADGKPNSYIVRRDGNNSAGVTYSIMGPDGIRRERHIS